MASAAEIKNSFSFVKGFITEASALTFPEDASIDEENYELNLDGSRSMRLGVQLEANHTNHAFNSSNYDSHSVSTFLWETVAEQADLNFLVVQVGNLVTFFDVSDDSETISDSKLYYSLFLDNYISPTASNTSSDKVSFSTGKGFLFVNSRSIEPLIVEYDKDSQTFSANTYEILVRDFEGVEDGLEVDERPTTLSLAHLYNLRNQGWPVEAKVSGTANGEEAFTYDPIDVTHSQRGFYPSNADIIYLAKHTTAEKPEAVGAYYPGNLLSLSTGTTRAPRGKNILNALNKVRSAFSIFFPESALDPEIIDSRPEAVAFYSGRVFLGLGSTIYYSQILTSKEKIGKCYQEADPTAEDLNELVATDGGTIEIPDAGIIKQLIAFGKSLIVFATNGVWQVDGSNDPFSATNNRALRISTFGVTDNNSGILADNLIFYTTPSGIYVISQGEITSEFVVQSLTDQTIKTFYLTNMKDSGSTRGHFDKTSKKVYWLWNSDDSSEKYNNILIFDTLLGAFYKYKFAPKVVGNPCIAGIFTTPRISNTIETFNVVDSSDNQIIDSSLNNVVIDEKRVVGSSSSFKFLSVNDSATPTSFSFAEIKDTNLLDWDSVEYEAFIETGYEINDDQMRFKQAPIIQVSFNQTEKSYIDNGSGGVAFDFPSSCMLSARWNWSDDSVSGKVTSEQEVYRFRRNYIQGSIGETFNTGLKVVTSRTKLRGRGRSLSLRFRTPARKYTDILGWSLIFRANTLV